MKDAQPKTIHLKNYQPPNYLITHTDLVFALGEDETLVTATLSLVRNPDNQLTTMEDLQLHGQELELVSIELDGQPLAESGYRMDAEGITVFAVPEQCKLTCVTRIKPQLNTSLEGLYKSSAMYCTQCEAEGFRKITYYLDRPDVMSEFTTKIIANKNLYPVLLSNGNLLDSGHYDDNRHWALWHDPFKKPAYLFALVAGQLSYVEDSFTTQSGRKVTLKIYVEDKDLDKCDHAMRSLKNAMRWDEEVYGREYDLDIFMIVAVDDFNMGAMENKGLNIFNTSCVLANPATTTDVGFQRVEGIVAHEYFHNWSGNRVTCRDWFQLSLKEGFTVFRDSEFSADMGSATVKRVEDVALVRTHQFAEDAGPMAHPVQPPSFIEISNFYTLTVYEKGAEIVRMIHTLLGPELFRQGSDLYFQRHDGQAVTIEDFVRAMADVSGRDFNQFMYWYRQAGTPRLKVISDYNEAEQRFTLSVEQSCPPTPEAENKEAFHIPLAMGLLGEAGALPLYLEGEASKGESADNTHRVLEVTQAQQSFVFTKVLEKPVPSLLRHFSAPVKLDYHYSRDELVRLMTLDEDGFCRWDASQQLGLSVIHDVMEDSAIQIDKRLVQAYERLLRDATLDPAMVALMLQLPTEQYLSEVAEIIDVDNIHHSRKKVRYQLATALKEEFWSTYKRLAIPCEYRLDAGSIARRSLKNTLLSYLVLLDDSAIWAACEKQYYDAQNMTDAMAALVALAHSDKAELAQVKSTCLEHFYERWQRENLVVNQWLMVQATNPAEGTLESVYQLLEHPAFEMKNPNKIRALIGAFANQNAINFHQLSGEGYLFLADQILILNQQNPQIAARLLTPLTKWRKYDNHRQQLMHTQLERLQQEPQLSKDVYEVLAKTLR